MKKTGVKITSAFIALCLLFSGCKVNPASSSTSSFESQEAGSSDDSVINESNPEIVSDIASGESSQASGNDAPSGSSGASSGTGGSGSTTASSSIVSNTPQTSSGGNKSSALSSGGTSSMLPADKGIFDNSENAMKYRLGVTNWGGNYATGSFLSDGGLIAGSKEIEKLGSKVLKLCANDIANSYKLDTWNEDMSTLKAVFSTKQFKSAFQMNFSTYVIVAYEQYNVGMLDGISSSEYNKVKTQFYEATKYLLNTYNNTNKTFILTNWEGDNILSYSTRTEAAINIAVEGLTQYFKARQEGVTQAQNEFGMNKDSKVKVFNALEINRVTSSITYKDINDGITKAQPKLISTIVPNVPTDLISYSSYECKDGAAFNTAEKVKNGLLNVYDIIKSYSGKSKWFGDRNVMISEFGMAESYGADKHLYVAQGHVMAAQQLPLQYLVYWELWCNEFKNAGHTGPVSNSDCRGWWLIRPDGTYSAVYNYFKGLF